jgi:hypothetical protein
MEIGWGINIETDKGIVGLYTNWQKRGFKIFYPLEFKVPDEIIIETLEVSRAEPVKNVMFGKRLWAPFYSEKLEGDYGRVWIDHNSQHSYGHEMYTIKNEKLQCLYTGHNQSNTIWTFEFSFCSEEEPDAPNCSEKWIQPYKERFIKLLVEVAKFIGNIQAVNIDSGLVLYTPETIGCKYRSFQEGNGRYCYAKDGDIEIMLRKGNSLIPWVTVIRYPITGNELTSSWLIDKLDSFDNSNCSTNCFAMMQLIAKTLS